MKWSARSSEDREFVLIVMYGTLGVVRKMLTDGGFVKLSGTGVLTGLGRALTVVWSGRIGNRFWDVLFNSLFKALRRATNAPTVTVAHKLVDYVVLMMGR